MFSCSRFIVLEPIFGSVVHFGLIFFLCVCRWLDRGLASATRNPVSLVLLTKETVLSRNPPAPFVSHTLVVEALVYFRSFYSVSLIHVSVFV